jgi:hypothetical protein
MGEIVQVGDVLLPERLVEAQRLAHVEHVLRPRAFAGDLHGRIAWDQMDQQEDQRQDPERNRDHLQQPAKDVLSHVLELLSR